MASSANVNWEQSVISTKLRSRRRDANIGWFSVSTVLFIVFAFPEACHQTITVNQRFECLFYDG